MRKFNYLKLLSLSYKKLRLDFHGLGVLVALSGGHQGQFAKQLARLDERQNRLLSLGREVADFGAARGQQEHGVAPIGGQVDRRFGRELPAAAMRLEPLQLAIIEPLEERAILDVPKML